METFLTDTLVLSGQLYLRTPSQNSVFLNSHINSVYKIPVSGGRSAPITVTLSRPEGVRLLEPLPLYIPYIMPRILIMTNLSNSPRSTMNPNIGFLISVFNESYAGIFFKVCYSSLKSLSPNHS